jgi:DNA polymerase delta subunit 1
VRSAHVELASKMRKRDPATAPAVGDRVAYVIVKGAKGAKAYEKAEDPIYALEHNVPVDVQHYLDHHLAQPLMRIFEPVLKNPRELLSGEHTRSISVATPSAAAGGIMRFARVRATCLGCRAPLPDAPAAGAGGCGGKAGGGGGGAAGRSGKAAAAAAAAGDKGGPGARDDQNDGDLPPDFSRALCKACLPRGPEVYARSLAGANSLERQFSRLWAQCQRCQGSLHDDVLCTSRDCPIFYRRKKVQKDLNEAHATLVRFGRPEEW